MTMKHLKAFEYNEYKYVIVSDHPSGLIVNVKMKSKEVIGSRFILVDTMEDNSDVVYYTLEAAKLKIISLSEEYVRYDFREMLSEDFDTLINANKYNL